MCVRRPRVLQRPRLIGQHLEGWNDMQSADSRTQPAGELHPYENGALRQDGAVRGKKEVLKHRNPSLPRGTRAGRMRR